MKLSLNIGLNALDLDAYGGFPGWLNACENDASALAALAAAHGYTSAGNLTAQARLAGFRGAMLKAADELAAGDRLFLSFSGHGSKSRSLTEWDLDNETLCFFDGQLLDDELHDLFARFREGVAIVGILDSCFSGGMDRALDGLRRPRVLPASVRLNLNRNLNRERGPRSSISAGVALICAAAEGQTANDGERFGEWTGALLKAWAAFGFNSQPTIADWFRSAAAYTAGQTPQLKLLGADISAQPAL